MVSSFIVTILFVYFVQFYHDILFIRWFKSDSHHTNECVSTTSISLINVLYNVHTYIWNKKTNSNIYYTYSNIQ